MSYLIVIIRLIGSVLQVEFCICLLLTILGYVPGIIYALYAIVFVDRDEYFDEYRRPLYAPGPWYLFMFSWFSQ